ncbi:ribosome-dependent ATPase [Lebetimonas natsushimae]|uniref:Ribosome-dependent ATPase n=1 Tax=Lebetimonas natsushimae TaxID=1936991 RepID=A0A292YBI4_9BACT|nr:ATP-binding cassette domain-containing protein [Lebetimonas natsushimae]GAX86883.1 ribosome-dependent ATPase [Lebetimonas natsushimae]
MKSEKLIFETKNVTVKYKNKIAIKDASIKGYEKEIIGFIGADGAGKSSFMYAISGVKDFEGEISYYGFIYKNIKEAEKLKKDTGFMPQGLGLVLYKNLSVKEHLDFFSDIRNLKRDDEYWEYRERLLKMAGLYEFQERLAKNLSGGMKQKLSLICTLIHKPKLLILDEPTTGVDPLSRRELWKILDETRSGLTIVSTAYMQEAALMDRVYLFDEGKIIAGGKPKELMDSIKNYVYEETKCDECITFNKTTYSLKPLKAHHKEPTLEGLFFVNALKDNKIPPKMIIKESKKSLPAIVLQAKALTKRFGDFTADDHVNLELKKGEILGLLGANGAGKTTLIKMLLGLYPIDEGELILLGRKIKSYEDRIELKSKIGYMSQLFALYKDMTIRENLIYFANMHKIPLVKAHNLIKEYAKSLGFYEYLDEFPKDVPLGINQRFSLTAAIMHEPVVLFLDEPTSGVDTIARAQFWDILHQLKEKWGISIIVTTHYMSEAEYCDRVVVLKRGKKIVDDSVENLHKKFPEARSFEEIFIKFYEESN